MQRHMVLWRSQMPASRAAGREARSWATPAPARPAGGLSTPLAALVAVGLLAAPILGMIWTAG